jgi:hypothetical protein
MQTTTARTPYDCADMPQPFRRHADRPGPALQGDDSISYLRHREVTFNGRHHTDGAREAVRTHTTSALLTPPAADFAAVCALPDLRISGQCIQRSNTFRATTQDVVVKHFGRSLQRFDRVIAFAVDVPVGLSSASPARIATGRRAPSHVSRSSGPPHCLNVSRRRT